MHRATATSMPVSADWTHNDLTQRRKDAKRLRLCIVTIQVTSK